MNKHSNTPKNFVIQLASIVALYVSITSLLILVFSITNLRFPDASAYFGESAGAREAIRVSIAVLIVFFPAFLVLTRMSNITRRKEYQGTYNIFGKWLVYLTLLIAGGVLLTDLVVLIMYLLNGETTTRFFIKVFSLFAIVGMAFHYYILDVRGYFTNRIDKSLYFAVSATVVVVTSLIFAFSYIETPNQVREIRLDDQQVNDLRNIYWDVEQYYQVNGTLPETLIEVYGEKGQPIAPEGRNAYTYNTENMTTFKLCGTFAASSLENRSSQALMLDNNYRWEHDAGEECFTRTIDIPTKPIN